MIIFDASTLILLAKIDILDPFISDYGKQVLIPEKVKEEVLQKGSIETPQIAGLIADDKIKVSKVDGKKMLQKLMDDFNIDSGESEAIALAMHHRKAAIVATDDRNAIRACRFLKIDFITAISVLIRAVEKRLLNRNEAILKLERLESVGRYKKTIIADARRRIRGGE
ncbi:MAG: hypothetical protein HZB85_09450 [Deltaproteobacteria bacterium]|nr:hypothetical protein [Deltaproteobacteria bacterium]